MSNCVEICCDKVSYCQIKFKFWDMGYYIAKLCSHFDLIVRGEHINIILVENITYLMFMENILIMFVENIAYLNHYIVATSCYGLFDICITHSDDKVTYMLLLKFVNKSIDSSIVNFSSISPQTLNI